jgi:TctA family transporter
LGVVFVVGITAVLGLIIFRNKALTETEVLPLALIGSLLTTPYAWVYEHLLLLIPSILIFLAIKQRGLAAFVWLLLVFVLPWGTFWLAENRASDTFTALAPLLLAAFFYYFRIAKSQNQTG